MIAPTIAMTPTISAGMAADQSERPAADARPLEPGEARGTLGDARLPDEEIEEQAPDEHHGDNHRHRHPALVEGELVVGTGDRLQADDGAGERERDDRRDGGVLERDGEVHRLPRLGGLVDAGTGAPRLRVKSTTASAAPANPQTTGTRLPRTTPPKR